jgi:limonene 1,2-monooxygenase
MMGIDVNEQRHRLDEGLDAIIRLLRGETVDQETDWFTLRDARLQLLPYQDPCFEIAVASVRSPTGPRLAGRHGLGLLSVAATDPAGGFAFLKDTWALVEDRAAEFGVAVDRSRWRLVAPIHLAPTKAQAYADVAHGLVPMMRFGSAGPFAVGDGDIEDVIAATTHDQLCDGINDGYGVVGTPDMAVEMIQRLEKQSGGFGTLLLLGHEWAEPEATLRSYDLLARYVVPEFQGTAIAPAASWDRLWTDRLRHAAEFRGAQDKATAEHRAERRSQTDAPPG